MSRIVASQILLPSEEQPIENWSCDLFSPPLDIGKIKKINKPLESLVLDSQKKMLRSMTLASVYLTAVCNPLKPHLDSFTEKDPFSVGVYCALVSLPIDYEFAKLQSHSKPNQWADLYIDHMPPKNALKSSLCVAPATIGIFLNIMGPITTYFDFFYGTIHALAQAEMDLQDEKIKAALICTTSTLDNPLVVKKNIENLPINTVYCENAAAVVLIKNDEYTHWQKKLEKNTMEFGISTPLIQFLLKTRK